MSHPFFPPVEFAINLDYLPLLHKTRDWVRSSPTCDYIRFFNNDQFKPEMCNATKFMMNDDYPYAFIRTFPLEILEGMYELVPEVIRKQYSVRREHARLFCNTGSLDWHTDAPYRTRAINIAVSDSLGDTTSSYTVRHPDRNSKGQSEFTFQYRYQSGYVVDIANLHRIDTTFHTPTKPRILFSFSIG